MKRFVVCRSGTVYEADQDIDAKQLESDGNHIVINYTEFLWLLASVNKLSQELENEAVELENNSN